MDNLRKQQLDAVYEFYFGGTVRASQAVGATDAQIEELLRHLGRPLPESYVEFLRHYDNMADVIWDVRQVIRSNFVGTPEQLAIQRELYQEQLQIGGEGEAWDLTLDVRAESPEQMKVIEWDMSEGRIKREWENFEAFLDSLIQGMNRK